MNFNTEVFEKSKFKRISLYEVHQNLAFHIDPILDNYEKEKNIGMIRQKLLSYAKGFVLETAVGTSRNVRYYPEGCKILAIDWASNMLEVALKKITPENIELDYKIDDTEKLTFKDDVFDTVVDTFGLESYVNPEKALNEMRRVCKEGGKILILACGLSHDEYLNRFLHMKAAHFLRNYGYSPNKNWDSLINKMNFDVEHKEKFINGTLHMYVLRNNK